jgi:hypothetical protein
MIVGTKHVSLLNKPLSKDNTPYGDTGEVSEYKWILNLLLLLLFTSLFLVFNFSNNDVYKYIGDILTQSSMSGLVTTNTLTCLNDTFLIGLLIYNQYFTHTVVGGILLLVSLIASIYISQVN